MAFGQEESSYSLHPPLEAVVFALDQSQEEDDCGFSRTQVRSKIGSETADVAATARKC